MLAFGVAAHATTYDDGPTLGDRLLAVVVRVLAAEHGFGIVVGADRDVVYIATPAHVLADATQIVVHGCKNGLPQSLAAERVAGFDPGFGDLALLRVSRPAGYQVASKALAKPEQVEVADPAWLLGRQDSCGVPPISGKISALPTKDGRLRVDMPGVLGGSSGAPVTTGRGLVGMTTDSDSSTFTALSLEWIAQRVRAGGGVFDLDDADNIPPGDPEAAERDLAETLSGFLLELHDAQLVLRQPTVTREYYAQTVAEYNKAAERFIKSMTKYDGTLKGNWGPEVYTAWVTLRERLWAAHQSFLFANDYARTIVETERVPTVVRDRMAALGPELVALQGSIAQFQSQLATLRNAGNAVAKP
ncbi:MAG: trypsin-like peptidase domain-containing protein [Proteobacteria bacterium]|nr:trypsin-like peptidase domain-containing protein [Pseudomonadota bacterium]